MQTTIIEDIDYGFKTATRHRIVLEQKRAMSRANAVLLSIPARSPDINPIEKIFHLVSKKLRCDALELRIQFESYKQFEERVIKTIRSIPVDVINKTILSMAKRMTSIIKRDGARTKYWKAKLKILLSIYNVKTKANKNNFDTYM